MLNTLRGAIVGAEAKPYASFTNRETGETRPAGTTYRVYLSEDFGRAPVEVKCTEADYRAALALGPGALVDALVDLRASNNRLSMKLESLTPASDNGAKVGK